MRPAPRVPFRNLRALTIRSTGSVEAEEAYARWLDGIKKLARDNLASAESVRIAWTSRFKVPRYPSFADYTPEEALLELWEQYYFENPDNIEMKGITKRRNATTGYSYYVTGDPLLDQLEEAFGRGERPDMSVLDGPGGGKDIFREPVFVHTEKGPGFSSGQPAVPQIGLQGVQDAPGGAKITASGAKVHHTDFSSDDWLKSKLEDDVALKALAGKLGGKVDG